MVLTPSYIQATHMPTWYKAWHNGYAHYCNAKLPVAKETCGRGRVHCCCHSSQFAPCQLSPSGRNKTRGGGEVGRSRGQQFNRAMWSSGTSLAIIVLCTNHSSSQMPAHMQHFSWWTSTYSQTAHRLPLICTPIQRRRWRMACIERKAESWR